MERGCCNNYVRTTDIKMRLFGETSYMVILGFGLQNFGTSQKCGHHINVSSWRVSYHLQDLEKEYIYIKINTVV